MPFDSSREGRYLMNQWLSTFRPAMGGESKILIYEGFQQEKIRDPSGMNFPVSFQEEDVQSVLEGLLTRRPLLLVPNRENNAQGTDDDIIIPPVSSGGSSVGSSGGGGPSGGSGLSSAPPSSSVPMSTPVESSVDPGASSEEPPETPSNPGSSYEYVESGNTWVRPYQDCSGSEVFGCAGLLGGQPGYDIEAGLNCQDVVNPVYCDACDPVIGSRQLCACCVYDQICFDCCSNPDIEDPPATCAWLVVIMCCYQGGLASFLPGNCCFGV